MAASTEDFNKSVSGNSSNVSETSDEILTLSNAELPLKVHQTQYSAPTFSVINNNLYIAYHSDKGNRIRFTTKKMISLKTNLSNSNKKGHDTLFISQSSYQPNIGRSSKSDFTYHTIKYVRVNYTNQKLLFIENVKSQKGRNTELTVEGFFGILLSFGEFYKSLDYVEDTIQSLRRLSTSDTPLDNDI